MVPHRVEVGCARLCAMDSKQATREAHQVTMQARGPSYVDAGGSRSTCSLFPGARHDASLLICVARNDTGTARRLNDTRELAQATTHGMLIRREACALLIRLRKLCSNLLRCGMCPTGSRIMVALSRPLLMNSELVGRSRCCCRR